MRNNVQQNGHIKGIAYTSTVAKVTQTKTNELAVTDILQLAHNKVICDKKKLENCQICSCGNTLNLQYNLMLP